MTTAQEHEYSYCALPSVPPPAFPAELNHDRLAAILAHHKQWANGTVLHYYFFDGAADGSFVRKSGGSEFVSWVGTPEQQDIVREAFQEWKSLGIGLEFREVTSRSEAEIRIGFMRGDGLWSYLGRDVLRQGVNARTMNLGSDISTAYGRAAVRHEIGHTLGMPHEHQNPNAGIVWDEEAVYEWFGGPPNNWPREQTFYNIIRKLDRNEVIGSDWDPLSVMHYGFGRGLIISPERYRDGIASNLKISEADAAYVRQWYPPLDPGDATEIRPFESAPFQLRDGEQVDFTLRPGESREYKISTFGSSDVVLVLFEEIEGELRFVAGDDDSAQPRNAQIPVRLVKDRTYVVRVRLYSSWDSGRAALMYW
ncbi:M12 family metallopeptidase [Sinosporangium siamense]|uniref:Peptidase metallopeptidase domain-containing protein n=1 Tax=Sinosporangium siamense TaxID=1367973 RepID=A0A919VAV8_9ACTN|nr:M12 family metallopeptidase [Sinosporangium siamense]GII91504.1 hypothetical protein Ssi02_17350 [Sinosporangium siamense]